MSHEGNVTEQEHTQEKEISFSKSIYYFSAIKAAMEAYEAYASFEYVEHEYDVQLSIVPKQPQHAQLIMDAFCNHVLFESIVAHRNEKGGDL